jgi:cytochrome c oxidase cbb3-type subunit 3/ubiquinol-cytochrome c reductase cytochrome c subunit
VKAQRLAGYAAAALALAMIHACDRLPGRPSAAARPLNPNQVTDFATLYGENCAGCHGSNGNFGAALPLNNPTYLAIVDDESISDAISKGLAGTSMPAFAVSGGGMLTDAQIKSIVSGMRAHWGNEQNAVGGAPPYASAETGDQVQGAKVYADYCASCHSANGIGGGKSGAIADPSFLALYSDQSLRTLIIAGRPDLGHPGWRDYSGKAPLDSTQVNDLVAWLSAKRGS